MTETLAYQTPADLEGILPAVMLLLFFLLPIAIVAPIILWARRRGESNLKLFDAFLARHRFESVEPTKELVERLAPAIRLLLGPLGQRAPDPFVRLARSKTDNLTVHISFVDWKPAGGVGVHSKALIVIEGLPENLPSLRILPAGWSRVAGGHGGGRRVHLPGQVDERWHIVSDEPKRAMYLLVDEPINLVDNAGKVEVALSKGVLAASAAGISVVPDDIDRFAADIIALAQTLTDRFNASPDAAPPDEESSAP